MTKCNFSVVFRSTQKSVLPVTAHEVRVAELLRAKESAGAAALPAQKLRANERDGAAGASTVSSEPDGTVGRSET